MSDMTGALCVGQWELFDSVTAADHSQAAELCRRCPVLEACDQLRLECIADLASKVELVGTWAGVRYGGRAGDVRIAHEECMFTDDEARACHAAHVRGESGDRVEMGERVYQRRMWRKKAERREAGAA